MEQKMYKNGDVYHISWLNQAIKNYGKSSINGNITINEFIRTNCNDLLDNVVELVD